MEIYGKTTANKQTGSTFCTNHLPTQIHFCTAHTGTFPPEPLVSAALDVDI